MSRGRPVAKQRRLEFPVQPVEVGKGGEISRVMHHRREVRQMHRNFAVKRYWAVDAVLPELVNFTC
jgi:hypothetical protein